MRISDLSSDVCSSDLGNIAGLLTGKNTPADPATLFDTPFSQFIKAETDSRSYFHINDGLTWANRLIVGAGLPYGNSLKLPFVQKFFIGGTNRDRKRVGLGQGVLVRVTFSGGRIINKKKN